MVGSGKQEMSLVGEMKKCFFEEAILDMDPGKKVRFE